MRAIKEGIKGAAFAIFPNFTLKALSIRSRRMIEAQVKELRLDDLARRVSRATNGKVAKGPFAGMVLDYEALPVHGAPKFLGTYEQELHQSVERAIELAPRSVLNVGCAEGYYAVGFAMRLPAAQVWVADADPKAQRAALTNARLNGVRERVSAVGIVRSGHLDDYLKHDGSLLFMDCEGAEFNLLNPEKDPVLRQTHILVEVHPEFGKDSDISRRFERSHRIVRLQPRERTIEDIPDNVAKAIDWERAANERQGEKSWLFMESI